ncbi:FkbM family methyltransferase [Candidatus Pelagibacter sp.]|nr:FkbM family methyltransferase [Candidatus Pelagibacter sp.]|tara:strand:- start:132 stop:1022 length:891 start_codon:yes stop_codon:yes gene_type:complete
MTNTLKTLNEYSEKIYSQFGEDGLIKEILNRIEFKNLDKWCVEFGARDGISDSNAHNLIKNHDYKAVLIEGDKKYFKKLCKNFISDKIIKLNKFIDFYGDNSLDNVLKKTQIPKNFDFLSIDIDGCDYFIFKSMELYRPKIVCIEFNHLIPNEVEFIQEKNFNIKQGTSALSLINLAKKKDYLLVGSTLSNLFFVDRAYKKYVLGNSEIHLDNIRSDKKIKNIIFPGYDGSLHTTLPVEISWHKLKISSKKFQILPFFLRKFPDDYNSIQKILFLIYREFLYPGRFIKKIRNFFNK